ncbi:protein O-GlcNAcase isoform X2 [Triplophysa rosa]|uniref:protein O-GlcNAcase n=1 Tax=Triplophysa rosa TaxID=992332 RepID=A0A9W8CBY6_TRIRA|nr:protein O-GlcNAcase isoform X2 [Triplophysa rosa]KAI7814585.1 putative bifunctional protein NCOAT-like [Triplophysa rosa]
MMEGRDDFLCGVVEGFYGRPWSMEQRKVLFQWMQRWGLNTYLYGPKDDLKHRLLWREVYSAEEEAQLKALIGEAESRALRFVYAISPGQDIVFSSSCDLTLLKRKLRQVAELGCHAFALLFDDIDHSMCQADREGFSSFAHAQVTVANEIFRFLGNPPVFLFCPTEYCSSLCTPSVSKSPYLLTIGEDLLPGISIIWTGKKVISRDLCADSLAEVQSVIRRPPLVWDNLHANDYDSRRVFLGPFKGRPPGLRAHLRGLLLNPNCEFEANFIPLHTLGSWHKEGKEERKGDEEGYGVERALSVALQDWMKELSLPLQPGRQVRSTDPKPSLSSVKSKSSDSSDNQHEAKPKTSITSSRSSGALASDEIPADPVTDQDLEAGENQVSRSSSHEKTSRRGLCSGRAPLSEAQIRLLVGLYYLPHEHGPPAQSLMQDLAWLKANCHCVSVNGNGKKTPQQKAEEWRGRAGRFLAACDDVALLHSAMVNSINRAVLYDLYPYIWDLRNTLLVAKAFICWLEGRIMSESSQLGSWKNCFHWCGASSGAELLGMEAEPWVFKGGLSGEVQMLMPVGTSRELFSHPPPLFPTCRLYNIRPFQQKDKVALYRMVHQLYQMGKGSQDATISHPDFIGDRCLGASLALCPEYSLVLEDELGVCGCAVGILDVRSFAKRCQATWLPAMRDKYPSLPRGHAATKEALLYCHDEQDYPDSQLYHFPSQLKLEALPELVDCSVSRSLITALLTALKANSSQGVFCEVQPTDGSRIEFLTKLGFLEILRGEARPREGVVLGRLL